MDLERLGKVIRRRREDLGLRQADLAEKSGVKKQAIYRIEKGLVPNLGQQRLGKIATALKTTIHDLLVESEAHAFVNWREGGPPESFTPSANTRRRLPPKAYEIIYEYTEKMERAGFATEEIEWADNFLADTAYNKISARPPGERTEEELIVGIRAGWQFIKDMARARGMKL